jgi:integrase
VRSFHDGEYTLSWFFLTCHARVLVLTEELIKTLRVYLIQKLLGHRDPRMVQRYSHHSVESLRNGIEVLERVRLETEKNQSQISHNEGP